MAKDLAIDVGIPVDTDEFHTFVACVDNILTHGCEYGDKMTDRIVEKCHTSSLPIAKKVLRECRRRNTSRHSKSKWWEMYYNKKGDVPRWPGRKPDRGKRPMSPMFDKKPGRGKRPMSPMFDKGRGKRPMSPMFNNRNQPMTPFNKRKRGYGDDRRNDAYPNDRRNDAYPNDRRNDAYSNDRRNYNDRRNDNRKNYNEQYGNYDSPSYERNSKKRKYR